MNSLFKEVDSKVITSVGGIILTAMSLWVILTLMSYILNDMNSSINSGVEVQREMTKALESNTRTISQFQTLLLRVSSKEELGLNILNTDELYKN